jgi:hypothetical protein
MSNFDYNFKCVLDVITYIDYNHETGEIKHLNRNNSNGSIDRHGYLIIKIKGKQYKAHRLAYAKYYNVSPKGVIDHINGIRLDNRIENLRDTTHKVNASNSNRLPNKDTGEVGIYIDKQKYLNKKFTLKISGKTHRFYTLEDAIIFKNQNK